MFRTMICILGCVLMYTTSFAANLSIESLANEYRQAEYNEENAWMYLTLDNVERNIQQQDGSDGSVRLRQQLSVMLYLNGPQARLDSVYIHPREPSSRYSVSTNGSAFYSANYGIDGYAVDDAAALLDSIGTLCRLLTWPTNNVSYRMVSARNRVDVKMDGHLMTLHLDPALGVGVLKSVDLTRIGSDKHKTFTFSNYALRQNLLFPRVWTYTNDDNNVIGTFNIGFVELFMGMERSCFHLAGMGGDLSEFAKSARYQDHRARVSKLNFTEDQKKKFGEVYMKARNAIIKIEEEYVDDAEGRAEAEEEVMVRIKAEILQIKKDGARNQPVGSQGKSGSGINNKL